MRLTILSLVIFSSVLFGCGDDFSDPNDPKFGTNDEKGLTINFDQERQTVHHFGGSDGWSAETIGNNWPLTDRNRISQLLFSQEFDSNGDPKGIGLSMWRTNLGAGSANMDDSGFASDAWFRETECALQPNGTYDWTQQTGTRWFMQRAKNLGVEYITAWITSPPYFMTKNGYTFITPGTPGYNLKESEYDNFGEYIANYVNYHQEQGLPIDYVSPINEPQYTWSYEPGTSKQEGSWCSNTEAADLVEAIDRKFTEKNVSAKLILPESGDLRALHSFKGNHSHASNQVNDFWNTSSTNYIGKYGTVAPIIAGHSYFSNSTVEIGIQNRRSLLTANNQFGVEFWQTEYSILGGDYLEGRAQAELNGIDYSLWSARIMHWDLTIANATGWSWWTSLSYPKFGDHRFRFGLLNWFPDSESRSNSSGRIEETKNLWAFGNFSQFIRPGYTRVEVDNTLFGTTADESRNLMASAYLSPDKSKIVILLINYSDANLEVPLVNYGDEGDFSVIDNTFAGYLTDNDNNLKYQPVAASAITIPDKSILTLVGTLSQ